MNEAYVSFEVAKLLKEKGFDWDVDGYYCEDCSYTTHDRIEYRTENYNSHKSHISAPTQQMAMRWLREVHKIDISVTPDDGSWWISITELKSWSCVFNGKVLNSDDIKFAYQGSTSTKEECYEAGLWYVFKNLI